MAESHIQLHLNTLVQCTFVPPSSCPLLSIDSEVMMQLLNTKSVTVTQLYVTNDAASDHRARVAGCDKARLPPNAGCSESPMGLRRWQWVMGVAANELAPLNVKKSELKTTLQIDEMIFALGEGKWRLIVSLSRVRAPSQATAITFETCRTSTCASRANRSAAAVFKMNSLQAVCTDYCLYYGNYWA